MICPNCRENNPEGSKICKNCGVDLMSESNNINFPQNNYNPPIDVMSNQASSGYNATSEVNEQSQGTYNPPIDAMNNQVSSGYNATSEVNIQPQGAYNPPVDTMNNQVPSGYSAVPEVNTQPQGTYNPTMDLGNNTEQGSNTSTIIKNGSVAKNKIFIIAIITVILILAVGGGIYFATSKNETKASDNDSNVTSAFFFAGSNSKSALYSADGKKLTDFIFTMTKKFKNGYALVKTDEGYGIIKSNGKPSVAYGKYKYMTEAAGMYRVEDNDKNEFLINAQGKVLYDLKGKELRNYICAESYSELVDKKSGKFNILNEEGKSLLELEIKENAELKGSCDNHGFLSINYDGKVYVISLEAKKVVYTIDSETPYCINTIDDDGKIMTFIPCTSVTNVMGEPKIIKDGKLLDLSSICKKVGYSNGVYMCDAHDGLRYLLDKDMNIGTLLTYKYANSISYIDNYTYALTLDPTTHFKSTVEFYQNGTLVKTVVGRSLYEKKAVTDGVYILKEGIVNTYMYKPNGEMLLDQSFKSIRGFYSNDVAIVSEDLNTYYLINNKGEKISEEYKKVTKANESSDKYFIVYDGSSEGVIDEKGKVVFDIKYNKVTINTLVNGFVSGEFITKDSKYVIYDIEKGKEIATFDKKPSYDYNYITINNNGKKQYYTYTGKLFYEE